MRAPAPSAASTPPSLCGTVIARVSSGSAESAASIRASNSGTPSPVFAESNDHIRAPGQSGAFCLRQQIALVQHLNLLRVPHIQLRQHAVHFALVLLAHRARRILHMDQHLRLLHLFERGAKRGDQRMRQIADKSHRIGEQNLAPRWQRQRLQLGVERREHARGLEHIGTASAG